MDLENDIRDKFTDDDGNVVGPEDGELTPYTIYAQDDDLSKSLGGSGAVKRLFDYMSMHVFLPWARALTKRLNSFTDRVSGIEKDVIAPAEQATANAQNAAELASAAAETAMAKGQAGSVLDVVTKQPLHFGTGDDETVAEVAPVLPGQTLIFDPNDTSWEDLLKEVAGKAPGGFGLGGAATEVESLEDGNALKNGFISISDELAQEVSPLGYAKDSVAIVLAKDDEGEKLAQLVISLDSRLIMLRVKKDGEFLDYILNPPNAVKERIELGNSFYFRTTEMYLGKPVYVCTLNVGTVPAGRYSSPARTWVDHGLNVGTILRFTGWVDAPATENYSGCVLPYFDVKNTNGEKACEAAVSKKSVGILSKTESWTAGTAYVRFWFTFAD